MLVGAAATIAGAPYISNAQAAKTTTWKIQSSWPGGIGLEIFKEWCGSIVEKTGGELAFQPFGAKDVVGDFQLFDAVKNGVIDAMNPFTLYWAGRMPLAAAGRPFVVESTERIQLGRPQISITPITSTMAKM